MVLEDVLYTSWEASTFSTFSTPAMRSVQAPPPTKGPAPPTKGPAPPTTKGPASKAESVRRRRLIRRHKRQQYDPQALSKCRAVSPVPQSTLLLLLLLRPLLPCCCPLPLMYFFREALSTSLCVLSGASCLLPCPSSRTRAARSPRQDPGAAILAAYSAARAHAGL